MRPVFGQSSGGWFFGSSCAAWRQIKFGTEYTTSRWRHNGRVGVSNHQPRDCLLNRLFRRRSKKTPKLRVTGLCAGNSPGTGEFPAQMANNAEKVSISWRYHEMLLRWRHNMETRPALGRPVSFRHCQHRQAITLTLPWDGAPPRKGRPGGEKPQNGIVP